jgi:hypothetical protein
MTFTEAAIEVLRREGKPLHFRKLTEIAIRESLLDHVGKIPEETMADQLAAHCRLPHADRRVIPVQQGTFALTEWGLDEDPAGLEGLVEPPPDEEPYRGRERHPIPSREMARGTGRGEAARPRRKEEEEHRGRRFPPPAEVAYEILAGAARALSLAEIASQGAERLLMPDAFVRDGASLRAALLEDNRRRESSGRKPLFLVDGDAVTLVSQPEPGERPAAVAAPARPAAAQSASELRRAALAALRRRLRECDAATIEHLSARLLEKSGFREVKVAKRGREHVIYTARRKMGLTDLRHGVRIVRNGADASRRDVTELRRDLAHYGAQIGVVVTAGEVAREARGEAAAAGQLPIVLLCGEALAEAFADAGLGTVPVVMPEVDEAFFRSAAELAEKEEAARRARREERERREPREREPREPRELREPREREPRELPRREEPAPMEAAPAGGGEPVGPPMREAAPTEVIASAAEAAEAAMAASPADTAFATEVSVDATLDDEGPEDEEEGEAEEAELAAAGEVPAGAEGAPGETGDAAGERRRRRRRRRRRGGRGRAREGAAQAQTPDGQPATGAAAQTTRDVAAPSGEAPPPAPDRQGGEGGPAAGQGP